MTKIEGLFAERETGPDKMRVDELSPDRAKNLILTVLHHCQFTAVVDNTRLRHNKHIISDQSAKHSAKCSSVHYLLPPKYKLTNCILNIVQSFQKKISWELQW